MGLAARETARKCIRGTFSQRKLFFLLDTNIIYKKYRRFGFLAALNSPTGQPQYSTNPVASTKRPWRAWIHPGTSVAALFFLGCPYPCAHLTHSRELKRCGAGALRPAVGDIACKRLHAGFKHTRSAS